VLVLVLDLVGYSTSKTSSICSERICSAGGFFGAGVGDLVPGSLEYLQHFVARRFPLKCIWIMNNGNFHSLPEWDRGSYRLTPLEKAEPDTDRWAIENGWISITPLRLDLTDETALARALE
jgi:hypothetical protein